MENIIDFDQIDAEIEQANAKITRLTQIKRNAAQSQYRFEQQLAELDEQRQAKIAQESHLLELKERVMLVLADLDEQTKKVVELNKRIEQLTIERNELNQKIQATFIQQVRLYASAWAKLYPPTERNSGQMYRQNAARAIAKDLNRPASSIASALLS